MRHHLARFGSRSPPVHRVNDGGKRMGFTLYRAKYFSGWAELLDATQTVVLQDGILTPDPTVSIVQKGGSHHRSLIHSPTGRSLDLQAGMIVDYPGAAGNGAAGPTMEATETAFGAMQRHSTYYCLGIKPFRPQRSTVLCGLNRVLHQRLPPVQKYSSSLVLSRNLHSTRPLLDVKPFNVSIGEAKELHEMIRVSISQNTSERDLVL